jgi:hypothetical protein
VCIVSLAAQHTCVLVCLLWSMSRNLLAHKCGTQGQARLTQCGGTTGHSCDIQRRC